MQGTTFVLSCTVTFTVFYVLYSPSFTDIATQIPLYPKAYFKCKEIQNNKLVKIILLFCSKFQTLYMFVSSYILGLHLKIQMFRGNQKILQGKTRQKPPQVYKDLLVRHHFIYLYLYLSMDTNLLYNTTCHNFELGTLNQVR